MKTNKKAYNLPRIYPSEQGLQNNLQILASPCFGRGVIHYVRSRMRFSENLKIVYGKNMDFVNSKISFKLQRSFGG